MAFGGIEEKWEEVEEGGQGDGFEPIPDGEYNGEIVACEEGQTRAGDEKIQIQWKITGPKFANRRLFQSLNTGHSSDKARRIAQAELKTLGRWNGLEGRFPKRADELLGWKANLTVGFWETTDGTIKEQVKRLKRPGAAAGPVGKDPMYLLAKKQYEASQADGGAAEGFADVADDSIPF